MEIPRGKAGNELSVYPDNLRKLLSQVCGPSGPMSWITAASLQSLTLKMNSVVLLKLQSTHLYITATEVGTSFEVLKRAW